MTVFLTVTTMLLAIPGGLLLAFLRLSPFKPVSWAATGFVEFFRATPLVLQIYWAYYVLPSLVDFDLGVWMVMHKDLKSTRRMRLMFEHLCQYLLAHIAMEAKV